MTLQICSAKKCLQYASVEVTTTFGNPELLPNVDYMCHEHAIEVISWVLDPVIPHSLRIMRPDLISVRRFPDTDYHYGAELLEKLKEVPGFISVNNRS